MSLLAQLKDYARKQYPQNFQGIHDAEQTNPRRFAELAERFLGWAVAALGEDAIPRTFDAFVKFTTSVNMAQFRYEREGRYANKTYAEVYADHYSQESEMDDYLWGIFLTNFLWAHHIDITYQFEDRFLPKLKAGARLVEIAPGHGGWGLFALTRLPGATLSGYDISPSSIKIARSMAAATGMAERAAYEERDALDLSNLEAASADGVICSFVIEHLENPERLLEVISHLLRKDGTAFLTGALTAAQVDHIYEFKHESEFVLMAEKYGLRAIEMLSVNPPRQLPRARFVPRSISLLLRKAHVPG